MPISIIQISVLPLPTSDTNSSPFTNPYQRKTTEQPEAKWKRFNKFGPTAFEKTKLTTYAWRLNIEYEDGLDIWNRKPWQITEAREGHVPKIFTSSY